MIECRFSLEVTKNGIQKSVYAKAGEVNARTLVVTLTQNGKVCELSDCTAMVFLENGNSFDAEIVGNTVNAVIPNAFAVPQVRICELRLSYNNSESVIYSPMFELVIEESLGNKAEGESLVDGVQYVIKQEHDSANSHYISMVSGLRDALDSKASTETVVAHYNEFNQAFSDRDTQLDSYVKRTDKSIEDLRSVAHLHSNKKTLDKLAESANGKLLFDGEEIKSSGSVLDVEVKTDTEDEYVLELTTPNETITTPNLKGKQGVSGVYVGEGDMPEGYNVQVIASIFDWIEPEQPPLAGDSNPSVSVKVEEITGGHRVSITTASGTQSFDVLDGAKGDKGDPYTLTEADKTEIANAVLDALPTWNGGAY